MLYLVFNFVLTTYKGILQKLSVREIQIGLLEQLNVNRNNNKLTYILVFV